MTLLPVKTGFYRHVGVEQGIVELGALFARKYSQTSQPAQNLRAPAEFAGHPLKSPDRDGDHAVLVL